MEDIVGGFGLPAVVGATVELAAGVPGAKLGAPVVLRAVGTNVPFVEGVLTGAFVAFDDGFVGILGVPAGACVVFDDGLVGRVGVPPGTLVAFVVRLGGSVGVSPGASVALDD
jgi:hypothetical protein